MQPGDSFDFSGIWAALHMKGSVVSMSMITDHFFPDPALVALVKAAAIRKAPPGEITRILDSASDDQ
jgi:hypothetical protein